MPDACHRRGPSHRPVRACYWAQVSRPLILVTNDDGVHAPGIMALAKLAGEFGEVVVSAPSQDRSGVSHSISLHDALRVFEVRPGAWAVTGTPVDCVYVGALHLCDRAPDLVLSGINHGYNLGSDVYYSGTVGAAREGQLRGCDALAVSHDRDASLDGVLPHARKVIAEMLAAADSAAPPVLLNLNVPREPVGEAPVVTRLGQRIYRDKVDARRDLQGRPYFWIGGPPDAAADGQEGTDVWATRRGFASLTPLALDCTAPSLDRWRTRIAGPDFDEVQAAPLQS